MESVVEHYRRSRQSGEISSVLGHRRTGSVGMSSLGGSALPRGQSRSLADEAYELAALESTEVGRCCVVPCARLARLRCLACLRCAPASPAWAASQPAS
jgi:hypothetical protein